MSKQDIIIFGTGEIAELAYFYITHDSNYKIAAFTCDKQYIQQNTFLNKPLIAFEEIEKFYSPQKYSMHVALSYNKLNLIREQKYNEAKAKGYDLISYVCSKSIFWPDLTIGDNCFILENQTIQPNVKIGSNVMIWSGNHLGHGCLIKDHTYISSHVCISGHTTIGKRCFVGVNSTFKDFITVGDRVFIAMGASVTKDIDDDAVIIGSQSTILSANDAVAIKLRKKYFNI